MTPLRRGEEAATQPKARIVFSGIKVPVSSPGFVPKSSSGVQVPPDFVPKLQEIGLLRAPRSFLPVCWPDFFPKSKPAQKIDLFKASIAAAGSFLPVCTNPAQKIDLFQVPIAAARSFVRRILPARDPLKSLHAFFLGQARQARRRNVVFCSASLSADERAPNCRKAAREEEERVLISEVLVQDKDGQELESTELLSTAKQVLKSCKPNNALTTKEVQEDVHRIIGTGYFASCMPVAEDTRDGVRLIFKVEPNQELRGLLCNGANVLPTKVIEDAFRNEYGKVLNVQRLNVVLDTLNGWYRDRGYFAQVTDLEILSDGILRLQFAEAVVNDINIRFLDRKTGEPTVGKTRRETLLRQLTTKKGQVYSLQQGRRDAETVFTMGIMEDVNIVPQAAGDTGMVDLTMNVVERVPGGFSAGGGLSGNGMSNGPLSGLVGSFAYSHRNMFGRNQKLNISLERGQVDSLFRINYTDPWIEGDDKRTSRSFNIQNSRSPATATHGPKRDSSSSHSAVTVSRLVASVDYSRPLRPKWSGTAGVSFQRAGARDDHGQAKAVDSYGGPLTSSGKSYDDMLIGKLEFVYTDSSDHGSSQLVLNTEQAIPILRDWLLFNRVNVRARRGVRLGQVRCMTSFSAGSVLGDLAPHEAFPIGGTNSVRGYDEGAVGSGRSFVVASGEVSVPLWGPLEGAVFADYGTDLGSGHTVPGDPASVRGKPGSGYGYGAGIRVDSPLGPLRLEYALNNHKARRFHFGIGYRN